MTVVSTHVYSAVLIGTPDKPLGLKGGQITLDAGSAPHVRGTIRISQPGEYVLVPGAGPVYPEPVWTPDTATLAALDSRLNARIRVTVDGTYPAFSQHREFDLGLRERGNAAEAGQLELALASDEALLGEYTPGAADDVAPQTLGNLRAVVNYVLNKAIPGAALQASPANDADVTPYWTVTNMLANPSGETNVTGWAAGQGASGVVQVTMASPAAPAGTKAIGWNAAAGDSNLIAATATNQHAVAPGRWYVFSAWIVSSTNRSARAAIQWWSQNGAVLSSASFGATVTNTGGTFKRVHVIAQAPAGATHMYPYVNTLGNTGGEGHYVDAAMLYEGKLLVPAFDGGSTLAGYTVAWSGAAHASTSTRTPVLERSPDALVWKAGQTALDFLAPLVQVAGYRLVCDEQRRWTLRSETFTAPDTLTVRAGVNMIDSDDTISRDSDDWGDSCATTYTWTDASGIEQSRVDWATSVTPWTKTLRFEKDTPYPGPGFSAYAVRRAKGRGREVTVTVVSDWRSAAEQPAVVYLENAATQVGLTQAVTFNLDNDRMTVSTRTTDTPLGAIDLLPGTINSLAGTINSL